ncbi:Plasmodium vivax Vir protein, putative [Plasmodium vivax]|uniref:Vir protein, putative n=1 Tax=Plasmodium vivax TaxID=5855 RepID=A0A1G4E891_PLAVI|nr:Plasmodium vivax Vir protein, putative [Plasmodium vivax]
MACSTRIENDSYDFFDNIDKYIRHSDDAMNDESLIDSSDDCNSFSIQNTKKNTVIGKKICEEFIKLFNLLPNVKIQNKDDPKYRNDWNFLSYWLNSKLNKSVLNGTICPNDFYEGMEHQCFKTLSFTYSSNLIHMINNDDLDKMNKLYNLYVKYSKLYNVLSTKSKEELEESLDRSDDCFQDYINARYLCLDNNTKYCVKLKKFRTSYENLFTIAKQKGYDFSKNFKHLPENVYNNIMSTALLGTSIGLVPLFGILYKFTPIGQLFNPKSRTLTKEYSNNGMEKKNNPLMGYENEQLNLEQERYNIKYHSV